MIKVKLTQVPFVRRVFAPLLQTHFSVGAVLAGTARGEAWVDDLSNPQIGYAVTTEGYYLSGNYAAQGMYPALRDLIPHYAYLVLEPIDWEKVLTKVWDNPFARKHARWNYQFQSLRPVNWRGHLPPDFQLVPIDQDLLSQTGLENYLEISQRVDEWESTVDYLQRGFGYCIVHNQKIVSRCIVDCVEADQCEIGVGTDSHYRRRGLATTVVAATVTEALSRGYRRIGWHCLASNRGSMAVAERVGFLPVRQYVAYSSELPSENAGDLSPAQYADWAEHYERASRSRPGYALNAAGAWALSGNPQRALENLERLASSDWQGRIEWVEHNWMLSSLYEAETFQSILSRLRQRL